MNFLMKFWPGSTSNKLDYVKWEEVSFKGNVYDFLVDYDAIDKSDISNIHRYLMVKIILFAYIKKCLTDC